MPGSAVFVIVAVTWLSTGVALSLVMGRRGHFALGWGILGAVLGPLAVLAAVGTMHVETEERPSLLALAQSQGGPVDVLVGIDGSPQSRLGLERVVALLGPQMGRLTLATVLEFDDVSADKATAIAELARHARLSGVTAPGQVLLYGQPARALSDFAAGTKASLLVVGTRGKGITHAMFGSTAEALAAGCPVPVLMVSDGAQVGAAAA